VQCSDKRWRPVEPSTFPLAGWSADRMGRLRCYGNALVSPQAQAFIESAIN
jgi:DNA (cytosine-5)-methyltransferase 1